MGCLFLYGLPDYDYVTVIDFLDATLLTSRRRMSINCHVFADLSRFKTAATIIVCLLVDIVGMQVNLINYMGNQ